jgi:hypothetical protein
VDTRSRLTTVCALLRLILVKVPGYWSIM